MLPDAPVRRATPPVCVRLRWFTQSREDTKTSQTRAIETPAVLLCVFAPLREANVLSTECTRWLNPYVLGAPLDQRHIG